MRRLKDPVTILLVVLVGVICALAFIPKPNPKPKPATIPFRGQLLAATAAYASDQADSNGVTVIRQRIVRVRLLPDGRVAAIVRMAVQGVNNKGTLDLLVILGRLWQPQSSTVLNTRVAG